MPNLIAARRQVSLRVVYAGPGLGGKTTNLRRVAAAFPEFSLSELAAAGERTRGGDFLPVELGAEPLDGWEVKLALSGVPGEVGHAVARAAILRNADVVVFVADSQAPRLDANLHAADELGRILRAQGRAPAAVPVVFQYNRADLAGALSPEALDARLNPGGAPAVVAVATEGVGVFETLAHAAELAVGEARRYLARGNPPRGAGAA